MHMFTIPALGRRALAAAAVLAFGLAAAAPSAIAGEPSAVNAQAAHKSFDGTLNTADFNH